MHGGLGSVITNPALDFHAVVRLNAMCIASNEILSSVFISARLAFGGLFGVFAFC
jgi:hypothetical protein